jgi:serine/threonine-protein kinase
MELLEGVPLSEYTGACERLPEALAISILRGTLRGLAHAHAAGIVHRDLKPENVFLARDPSGQFAVKLLDFGIAKVMDAAGGMGTRTRTGALLGTPAYMSPEQARNAKDTDARSDLWSAGVLLFQMLTGEQPFIAPSEFARLALVLSAAPKPLAAFDVALAKWQPVIDRALCKDRALRFQSAAEMEAALDVPLASASPPPARTPAGKLIDASRPHNFTPEAFGDTDMSLPEFPPASPQPQQAVQPPRAAASSTLSSPYSAGPEGQPRSFVPVVNIVPSARGDLESNTFRGRPEGVRGSLVALLVMLALAAGLVTGFALGRL